LSFKSNRPTSPYVIFGVAASRCDIKIIIRLIFVTILLSLIDHVLMINWAMKPIITQSLHVQSLMI